MFFVRREEFAFLFQTFSKSEPPGKAPLTRGRYVFQKKEKKEEEEKIVRTHRLLIGKSTILYQNMQTLTKKWCAYPPALLKK